MAKVFPTYEPVKQEPEKPREVTTLRDVHQKISMDKKKNPHAISFGDLI